MSHKMIFSILIAGFFDVSLDTRNYYDIYTPDLNSYP